MNQNMPVVIENRQPQSVFLSMEAFENGQRMAQVLSKSQLIPKNFQNNLPDCIIALELAMRIGASPMAVLQNTYIVHGKPGYSATFIIAMINTCGRYSPLRFDFTGEGDGLTCVAWAKELATGEKLEGPPISIDVAKKEGWFGKAGSKWQTMPDLMLRYRAATFFGRMYAPELLMGMRSVEELKDTGVKPESKTVAGTAQDLNDRFSNTPSNDVAKQEHEKTPVKEKDQTEKPEPVKGKVEIKEHDHSGPQKLPGVVARLTAEIKKIDSLKTMELWMNGSDEIIDRDLQHNDDKKEIKDFASKHHEVLTDEATNMEHSKKQQQDEIDQDSYKKERSKIDKLNGTVAIDRWRLSNHERISSSYNKATADAILNHASDVYSVFETEEGESSSS